MASTELNTVLRRNASGMSASPQARHAAGQAGLALRQGAAGLHRRLPLETRERLVAPVSGFLAAAIEISATYPMEWAKTQQQLHRGQEFNLLREIRSRGLGVYQGLAPLLIGAPIQGLLRFSTLDYFNQRLRDPVTGHISVASGLAAGLGAGVLESCVVVTPMETVKTRLLQSQKGLVDGVRYIVARDGVAGLYKGLSATIAKSASNQGLRFIIFNQYKNMLLDNPSEQKLSPGQALVGGMLAGFLGALGNTPFDTIKSRTQSFEAHRYNGVVHCAQTIVKEEGVLALWKGLVPRLGRVLPGQGIIFMSYESISSALRGSFCTE